MSEIINGAPEKATTVGPVGTHATTIDPAVGKKAGTDGVVSTDGKARGYNKSTISQKLAKINPARTPLDTVLRNISSGTTKSDKYEFYSIISRGIACKVKSSTIEDKVIIIELESGIHHLSKDGDLMVPTYNVSSGAAEATDKDSAAMVPLVLHIVDIDYVKKTISAVAVNAAPIALPAETVMYRMASAKDQDAAISNDPHATPTKDYNYCQRNIMTVSENAFQALQEKEIEFGMAEFKEQAFLDFRYQAETQTIFGPRTLVDGVVDGENFIDPITQKRKLHMRGLLDFNIQNVTIPRNDPDAAINSMMEQMFSVNNGSDERIMLYGAGFATFLANSNIWTKQMDAKSTEVIFGIRWKTIESNFGVLRCIYHPALSLLGPYTDCAIIIDPTNIRRVDQIKLHQRKLDLQTAGIRNSMDVLLEESWTLEVVNPSTHGLVRLVDVKD